jgi:predicted porin
MRRAYLLYGDLTSSPFYASIGKMDIPFGLNDTVNPFTNSTNWHSFSGLAYGAKVGYAGNNLNLRAMAVQGGAQFRNANTSVNGSAVPSKLNNFALDANYTFEFDDDSSLLAGLSYQHGSAYCQDYEIRAPRGPNGVKHFENCDDENPAVAAYLKYINGKLNVIAEYAQTLDEWPGTFNPVNPEYAEFAAQKNTTFTLGASYGFDFGLKNDVELSAEFSRFIAGDDGSPWEKQDQLVLGASYFLNTNVKLFAEYIHVDGWVPLNFLSGGNTFAGPSDESWSDQDATTDAIVLGVTAAF